MKIKALIEKIESSLPNTKEEKEKLLKKLLVINLAEISKKEFSVAKQQLLEDKINSLFGSIDFNNISLEEIKIINKKRIELKKFLHKELHVIPQDYFRSIGLSIGFIIGLLYMGLNYLYPLKTHFLYFYILFGILGLALGFMIDHKIKKQSESLKL